MKSVKNTKMQPMYVLETQVTTATKATMMQTKSSSAAVQRSVVVQQFGGVMDGAHVHR